MNGGLWSLWAKGCAVEKLRFLRLFHGKHPGSLAVLAGELSTNPRPGFALPGFGVAARNTLGLPSPSQSKERRTVFALRTRTVAWASKPVFLQGGVS